MYDAAKFLEVCFRKLEFLGKLQTALKCVEELCNAFNFFGWGTAQ